MTFSYDEALSTDKDWLRLRIGATEQGDDADYGKGPKPDKSGFSNEELNALITDEGSKQRALCALYETLSGLYAAEVDMAGAERRESLANSARRYESLAASCRKEYGYPSDDVTTASRAGVRHPTRIDGYSSDVSADET